MIDASVERSVRRLLTIAAIAIAAAPLVPLPGAAELAGGVEIDAASRTSNVHDVPGAIAHNCSRDVTRGLLTWIASVPDDSTLSFGKKACYRIDESLQIVGRQNLTFEGNGATFEARTAGGVNRRHFWFLNGGGFVVRDLTVRGANPHAGAVPNAFVPDRQHQHAFDLSGVHGAVLDHVQAFDVYGDFVYVGSSTRDASGWSRDVQITNSHFERSGRQGISITAAQNVLIEHNTIRSVARSVFDFEPNTGNDGVHHVQIVGNQTGAAKMLWLISHGGKGIVDGVTVTDNVMQAPIDQGLVYVKGAVGGKRGPFDFERNQLLGGSGRVGHAAFTFIDNTEVTVRNNTVRFPDRLKVAAVEFRGSDNVNVAGNTFTGLDPVIVVTDPNRPHEVLSTERLN